MLASMLLTAAMWPDSVTEYCAPVDKTLMVGVAKTSNGNFLYCELVEQPSQHLFKIDYVKDKKVFAVKELNYTIGTTMPSVMQKDFRFGEIRQAEAAEQKITLYYQENNNTKSSSAALVSKDVNVIDAGFDNFLRIHWDELQSGKTLSINFASIAHLKTLPLRISHQPLAKCAKEVNTKKSTYCFYVEIDNAFLRMLLGNIKLIYDEQQRLEEFNGVVNILSEKESNQTAKIHYYYRQDYLEKPIP
jgi:hypothetical protein